MPGKASAQEANSPAHYAEVARLLLSLSDLCRPSGGWIREWRKLKAITNAELSRRLQVSRARVSTLERDEANQAVTLKSMQRAAKALDCEFVYALVPRRGSKTAQELAKQFSGANPPPLEVLPKPLAQFLQQLARDQSQDQIHNLLGKFSAQHWRE